MKPCGRENEVDLSWLELVVRIDRWNVVAEMQSVGIVEEEGIGGWGWDWRTSEAITGMEYRRNSPSAETTFAVMAAITVIAGSRRLFM
ncbi:hypothetical protein OROGR_011415 [Orobanche gracilis]